MPTKKKATKQVARKAQTILVIPDPHAHYQHPNDRADFVSTLVDDLRPDTILCGGDLFDMPSLSSYDKGKACSVGRTFQADVAAGIEFMDRMFASARKARQRYSPRTITLIGNHSHRIARALQIQPELAGLLSYDCLRLGEYFDIIVKYEGATPGTITLGGILVAHFLTNGNGRPIAGTYHANALLNRYHCSCLVFHSHQLNFSVQTTGAGKKIMGLVAGCFIDPAHRHDYAGLQQRQWWSGATILRNVEDGTFDPEFVSLGLLKGKYGK